MRRAPGGLVARTSGAALRYMNADGRVVNTAEFGAGAWQIDTSVHDRSGNVIWTLTPGNRVVALNPAGEADCYVAGLDTSAARASALATISTFAPETNRLLAKIGPSGPVTVDGEDYCSARTRTGYTYDEGKPDPSAEYGLVTSTVAYLVMNDGSGHADFRTTRNSYDPVDGTSLLGDSSGWVAPPTATWAPSWPSWPSSAARPGSDPG
jgi:hypothetical protein